MPLLIEGESGEKYTRLVEQHRHLISEYHALGRIRRKDRNQRTRFMRLKNEILPKIIWQIADLQNKM